jgi:flagellar FliL protein
MPLAMAPLREGLPMSEAAETPAAAPKAGKLLPILTFVNSAGIAAVLAVVMLKSGGSAASAHEPKPAAAARPAAHGESASPQEHGAEGVVGPSVKLPDFVIHLRDSDADRYARISFEAEVGGEKDKSDLTARLAVVRDVFIAYLSDRTLEELRGSEGLAQTKAALLKKLAGAAPGVRVVGLYVTDLVMQ